MKTLAEQIIQFNRNLMFNQPLPNGFDVLNPFLDNPETMEIMSQFYHRFYDDNRPRKVVLGINPGRLGSGTTGVPFTDTKRLEEFCGIRMKSAKTHEVSSMFVYQLIEAYGGVEKFYGDVYINSPFPLAIVREKNGNWVNANYYDDKQLFKAVKAEMIKTIQIHQSWGMNLDEIIVMGKKNADFIQKINAEYPFFTKMTVVEHPRYIQQYKSKNVAYYIDKYLQALKK